MKNNQLTYVQAKSELLTLSGLDLALRLRDVTWLQRQKAKLYCRDQQAEWVEIDTKLQELIITGPMISPMLEYAFDKVNHQWHLSNNDIWALHYVHQKGELDELVSRYRNAISVIEATPATEKGHRIDLFGINNLDLEKTDEENLDYEKTK